MTGMVVGIRLSSSRVIALLAVVLAVAGIVVGVAAPVSASPKTHGLPAPKVAHARPWQTARTNHRPSSPPAVKPTKPREISKDGEIPSMRTRFSSTFAHGKTYQTTVSTAPVHYKNSAGDWVPIDDTLSKNADGVASPAADDYSVQLPADLSGPVVSSKGDLTVSSQLQGAAAVSSTISGATATYAGALPNVDAVYTVHPDFLEESLRLHNAQTPSMYAFAVDLPAGYTLAADPSRALNILDAAGKAVGSLPAPVMRDSSKDPDTNTSTAIHYAVAGTAPHYTVTITADEAWLKDSARVWPVMIDPSVTFGTSLDLGCYITSPGSSDPSLCAGNTGTDNSLLYGHTAFTRHILLRFGDLTGTTSPIPADAVVTQAQLDLHVNGFSNSGVAMDTAVYRVADTFSSGVTWTTSDGTTAWPAGGHFGPTIIDNKNFTPTSGATLSIYPTLLVNGWIHGDYPNQGLGIKLLNDTGDNTASFYGMANANHPTLTVTWQPTVGQTPWVGSYDHRLSDRVDLHVDRGSGNLVVNNTDEVLSSPGQPLVVGRTYNSALAADGATGDLGAGWSMNGGADVSLQSLPSGAVISLPGGAPAIFYRNFAESDLTQDDAFVDAPGLDATLTRPDGTHFKLSFHSSHVIDNFTRASATDTTAWLSSVQNRAHDQNNNGGNIIDYTVTGSPAQTMSVADTTGDRSVHFTYTGAQITSAAETLADGSTGRSWDYRYDGSGHLDFYDDPAGNTTQYCYTGNLLTRIITPTGQHGATCTSSDVAGITDISYDTAGRVATITYENTGSTPNDTVTFSVDTAVTTGLPGVVNETDPYGKTTHYTFDTNDRITLVQDPLANQRSASYDANNDLTAAVSANNYTGTTGAPSSTATFDPTSQALTSISLPTSVTGVTPPTLSFTYNGAGSGGLYLPSKVTDDRGNPTGVSYSGGAPSIITGDQLGSDSSKQVIHYEGDTVTGGTAIVHCGPAGAAAFPGALCQTEDPLYDTASPTLHHTVYTYDAMGELVTITPPTPGHGRTTPANTTIGYDAYSRPTSITDGKGQHTTIAYDTLDRVTKITYDDGTSTTYTYNEDGDRTSQIDKDAGGTITHQDTYTYDAQNRIATETNGSSGIITLGYDGNSRLVSYTDAGGTVTYGYDDAGGLTSLTEPGGDCTGFSPSNPPTAASLCTIFALDKSGNRVATIYPGDEAQQIATPDEAGRLGELEATAGATTLYDYTYSYATSTADTLHLDKRTNQVDNSFSQYAYDGIDRLTIARNVSGGGSVTNRWVYCYDDAGNRTSSLTGTSAVCPASPDITFDGANQALTNTDGTTYTYDLDGNLTNTVPQGTGTGTTYTYNDRQQQTTAVTPAGTTTRTYAVTGNDELLSVTAGGSTTNLLNSPLGISAITTGNSTIYATRDPSGALIGYRDGPGSNSSVNHTYVFTDERGSVTRVVDPTGALTGTYGYDPYGTLTTGTPTFGYTGGYSGTGDTSSTKLGARYDNPLAGTFTQTDPITSLTHPGQNNPYTYAGGDPINQADPNGLSLWGDIGNYFEGLAVDNYENVGKTPCVIEQFSPWWGPASGGEVMEVGAYGIAQGITIPFLATDVGGPAGLWTIPYGASSVAAGAGTMALGYHMIQEAC